MKLKERNYQTVTQVNVLSPEIFNIPEVDLVHLQRRHHFCIRHGEDKIKNAETRRGLSQWYDNKWKLSELGRSCKLSKDVSMRKRVENDEELQKVYRKSDSFIVLGEWESHLHGEGNCGYDTTESPGFHNTQRL